MWAISRIVEVRDVEGIDRFSVLWRMLTPKSIHCTHRLMFHVDEYGHFISVHGAEIVAMASLNERESAQALSRWASFPVTGR